MGICIQRHMKTCYFIPFSDDALVTVSRIYSSEQLSGYQIFAIIPFLEYSNINEFYYLSYLELVQFSWYSEKK
jgi:hypothetical protein